METSASLLLKRHFIEWVYLDGMLDLIEKQGSYLVTDGSLALLHGRGNGGTGKTNLSLLVNKQPVASEDKGMKIIFCLTSGDDREYIPTVVTLMRMVRTTSLIQDLE